MSANTLTIVLNILDPLVPALLLLIALKRT